MTEASGESRSVALMQVNVWVMPGCYSGVMMYCLELSKNRDRGFVFMVWFRV